MSRRTHTESIDSDTSDAGPSPLPAPGRVTLTSRLPPTTREMPVTPAAATAQPVAQPSDDPFGLHLLGAAAAPGRQLRVDRPVAVFDQRGLEAAPPQELAVRRDAGAAAMPSEKPTVIQARLEGAGADAFRITPTTQEIEPDGEVTFDVEFAPPRPGAHVATMGFGPMFLADEAKVALIGHAHMAAAPGPVDPDASPSPKKAPVPTSTPTTPTAAPPPAAPARSGSIDGVPIARIEAMIRAGWSEEHKASDVEPLARSSVRTENGETIAAAAGPLVEEYRSLVEALRDYEQTARVALNEHGQGIEAGRLSPIIMSGWEYALAEAPALRRALSAYLVDHYNTLIAERSERIRSASADMKRYRQILRGIEDGKHAAHLAEIVVEIGEYAEIVEHVAQGFLAMSRKAAEHEAEHEVMEAAAMAMGHDAKRRIGHYGKIVEKGMLKIAAYFDKVALAQEAMASVEELEHEMRTTMDGLDSMVAQQTDDTRRLVHARAASRKPN